MLVDERFQSSMESEEQCHWLPVQVLNAVHNTAMLSEATQVDVMKVSFQFALILLDMPLNSKPSQ